MLPTVSGDQWHDCDSSERAHKPTAQADEGSIEQHKHVQRNNSMQLRAIKMVPVGKLLGPVAILSLKPVKTAHWLISKLASKCNSLL